MVSQASEMPLLPFAGFTVWHGLTSLEDASTGILKVVAPGLRVLRRPADGSVKHCIGQIMTHKRYHYKGLIYGEPACFVMHASLPFLPSTPLSDHALQNQACPSHYVCETRDTKFDAVGPLQLESK